MTLTLLNERVHLFQVYYDEASYNQLDPAFTPLDNRHSPRPDLAEYASIRLLFTKKSFRDDDYIGVFSPRFHEKTGLTGHTVRQMLLTTNQHTDLFSFSPFFDESALFLNPFEQGEHVHTGLISAANKVISRLGIDFNIATRACDITTTIFANYFVAQMPVWRQWLHWSDLLDRWCADPSDPLGNLLNSPTVHRGGSSYPLRVFIQERLISLILETAPWHSRYCLAPLTAPCLRVGGHLVMDRLLTADALKTQYRLTANPVFLNAYIRLRNTIIDDLSKTLTPAGTIVRSS